MSGSVTVFSAGIASFARTLALVSGQPTPVTLAVKDLHLSDLLESLRVQGGAFSSRPSFTARVSARERTGGSLSGQLFERLGQLFAGQQVSVGEKSGVLIGIQGNLSSESNPGVYVLLQLEDGTIETIADAETESLSLKDPAARAEFERQLRLSAQALRSDTSEVKFEVSGDGEATLSYLQPAVPAVLGYQVVQGADGALKLSATALVRNDTGEDWKDVTISIVNGTPIDFSTNFATASPPRRSNVAIAPEEAEGEVHVAPRRALMRFAAASAGPESVALMATSVVAGGAEADDEAEGASVNGFYSFTSSEPVTINAGQGVIVPLFERALDDGTIALFFDPYRGSAHPHSAVLFTNKTGHTLGRGVVVVTLGSLHAGKAVLATTQGDQSATLPFAVENRVVINSEQDVRTEAVLSFATKDGVATRVTRTQQTVHYRIWNGSGEKALLFIQHRGELGENTSFKLSQQEGALEEVEGGVRIRVEVPAGTSTVQITESAVVEETGLPLELSEIEEIAQIEGSNLGRSPEFLALKQAAQAALDARTAVAAADKRAATLERRQEELRKNLSVMGQSASAAAMLEELAGNDQKLVALRTIELPELHSKLAAVGQAMQAAAAALALEWSAEEETGATSRHSAAALAGSTNAGTDPAV